MSKDCLYCKSKKGATKISSETTNGFIIDTMKCFDCGRSWKDFYGDADETSPVLSIQRNTDSN